MASTVMQDPRSTQARSAWIAGLTEACTKITNILNMGTSHLEDLQLVEERPTEDDKCRIYIAPLGSKLWLQSPKPVVKLDGNIITKDYYGYSIDYLGGSVIFEDELNRPAEGSKITVTVDYISTNSEAMTAILDKLKELEEKAAKNYKGYYGTATDLEAADVTGVPGDYVIIEDVNEIWVWNAKEKKYVSTYKVPDLSPYYTKVETDDLLEQKEDFIRAHGDTNASDAFYWGGRKTWVDLYQKVRETALTGVVFTDETKILETDSILTALGKLQGQINAKIHDILGTGEPTDATVGRVGQEYINTSNGDKYHLTTITTDGKYIWEKYANVSGVLNVPGGATAKLTGNFGTPPYEFEFKEDTDTHVNSFNGRTGAVTPQSGDYTADMVGAVPTTRKVNGKQLNNDITLSATDIDAVPTSRTINGQPLTSDIEIAPGGVGKSLAGQSVSPASGTTVTAGEGAEIFNDYRERGYYNENVIGSENKGNIAAGRNCHAEGEFTTAVGICSHAEGGSTTAGTLNYGYSHAEGWRTIASGSYAHAEGWNTTANGIGSHAEGHATKASGDESHAEGLNTVAKGQSSHASGSDTIANDYQFVIGTYNVEKEPQSVYGDRFIIGSGWGTRENCFRVHSDGSCYANGGYNSSGADYAELFEWADGNLNNQDRAGLFTALDGDKIRIANPSDEFILGIVSGNPSVVADVYDDQWAGMYVTDVFGRTVYENVKLPEKTREMPDIKHPGKTITEVVIPAHTELLPKLNSNYNPHEKYNPRTKRPEWDAVGLIGKLVAIDNGTCKVNGWATVGNGGIAIESAERTKYRVMKRLDGTHVQILILP